MNVIKIITITLFSFLLSQNLITNIKTDKSGNIEVIQYFKKFDLSIELVKEEEYYRQGQIKNITSYSGEIKTVTNYFEDGSIENEFVYKNGELWSGSFDRKIDGAYEVGYLESGILQGLYEIYYLDDYWSEYNCNLKTRCFY